MTNAPLFPPTRAAGLGRLAAFVPRAGRDYAQGRNADPGPGARHNVSQLSPWLRHRLVTEAEVVDAVLARHSFAAAEKFVQEVLWRTYWKGWLELRPAIWDRYTTERGALRAGFRGTRDLARAEAGATGIAGFDDWAQELVATGYLHNHARMWFASIWIFTLRLPWVLGADFFMRHLVDADPASNTLSWRWVAGLQTPGKTYLARADNIARYTDGRFAPQGLATTATALTEPPPPAPAALAPGGDWHPDQPALLLVTSEDMHPESAFAATSPFRAALIVSAGAPGNAASQAFVAAAAADTAARVEAHFGCPATVVPALDAAALAAAAAAAQVTVIVTAAAPVGPTATALAAARIALQPQGVRLIERRRAWDTRFWPHARKGFFAFKEQIEPLLGQPLLL